MKKKRIKKAFTIVELVIVIAVIGILSAILIPTFVNLTNKANKAADEALLKNLNTTLAIQERELDDEKNITFNDAMLDLKKYGYSLSNLTNKSDEALLWNQKTNRFIFENDNKEGYQNIDFWKIQDSVDQNQKYSIYASDDFSETSITISVGFDAGNQEDVDEINYINTAENDADIIAQEVIIRTNGGTLTIDAKKDNVIHYGQSDIVEIKNVAPTSYYEHGEISFMSIAKGRVVLEENSVTGTLYLKDNDSKACINPLAKTYLIAKANGITPSEITRGGLDISSTIETKTASQIAAFVNGATRYLGGNGTTTYPYLISKFDHMNVSLREDIVNAVKYYYQLVEDIDLGDNFIPLGALVYEINDGIYTINTSSGNVKAFIGCIDGCNHTIKLKQRGNIGCLFYTLSTNTVYIRNVTLDVDIYASGNATGLAYTTSTTKNKVLTIENVGVKGKIVGETGASGFFITFITGNGGIGTMRNCTNYANISVKKLGSTNVYCSGFVNKSGDTRYKNTITFENCRNEGDLICDITDPDVLALVNTSTSKYYSIMGHIVGSVYNSKFNTSGYVTMMKFINCSFKQEAKLEGYSAKSGRLASFEGFDRSANKNTYSTTPNFNKQLIGGIMPSNVLIGITEDATIEYIRDAETANNYFAHGGTAAAPGRTTSTTANYPKA